MVQNHKYQYILAHSQIHGGILSNAVKYTPSNGSVDVNVDELLCDEP